MNFFYLETGDEDAPPETRPWRLADGLSPQPPRGWLMATYFTSPDHPVDIGCWLYVLATAQAESKARGAKLHAMARDRHGFRVLLVDPSIRQEMTDALETVHYAMESEPDSVEPYLQERAAVVIAQRKWAALPMAERIEMLDATLEGADLGLAFAGISEIGSLDLAYDVAYNT